MFDRDNRHYLEAPKFKKINTNCEEEPPINKLTKYLHITFGKDQMEVVTVFSIFGPTLDVPHIQSKI